MPRPGLCRVGGERDAADVAREVEAATGVVMVDL
jgi:hypothetical protein